MENLLELQNEGNELGLANTTSKSSTQIEGMFQSPRFKTIGFWSRSNFP